MKAKKAEGDGGESMLQAHYWLLFGWPVVSELFLEVEKLLDGSAKIMTNSMPKSLL